MPPPPDPPRDPGPADPSDTPYSSDPAGPADAPPPNPYVTTADVAGLGAMLARDPAAQAQEQPSRSSGAHRSKGSPSRYVLPALVGALVLVAVGVGLAGWMGSTSDSTSPPPVTTVHVPTSTAPTGTTATSASGTPSTASAAPTSAKPTTPSKPPPTHTATPTPVKPPVVHAPAVILNQTVIRGMAAQVAQHLRSLGWTITGVGNWRGRVPSTTVYYPAGLLAAARSMAYDLGTTRIHTWVRGMLPDRLTVVLTSDPYS